MTRYRRELNTVLVDLVNKVTPLMEQYANATSGTPNDYSRAEAGRIDDKAREYKRAASEAAINARDGYIERLDKKIKSFSGGTINDGDIQIINSPIMVMSPEEYDLMCERYEGNRTMERLLIAYSEKHEDQSYKDHFMTDNQKKEIAYSLCRECEGWINNGGGFGIKDYVVACAGEMFGQADLLKE